MKAKKSLGQHFLTDKKILGRIVDAANPKEGSLVLEIGPGKGALTRELLDRGLKVVAIEKDLNLIPELQEEFSENIESRKLNLIEGDILETDLSLLDLGEEFSVIANIPYYITGQILRKLLSGNRQPTKATLLVQKEIAERAVAKDNKESLLSISIKAYGEPRMGSVIKKGSFLPPPKVDSAVLIIENISKNLFENIDENRFFDLLRDHFQHKRKQLGGSGLISNETFTTCDISPTARPEELSLENWGCIAKNEA